MSLMSSCGGNSEDHNLKKNVDSEGPVHGVLQTDLNWEIGYSRGHSHYIWAKYREAFCLCLGNPSKVKFKRNGCISCREEISKQHSFQHTAWLSLTAFSQTKEENKEQKDLESSPPLEEQSMSLAYTGVQQVWPE